MKIASITIAFNPEATRFVTQLHSLLHQVDLVIVFDNASKTPVEMMLDADLRERVRIQRSEENLGIAAALNRGIDSAREQRCELALLMDHDSVPADGMVATLTQRLIELENDGGAPVAAVGPRIVDPRNRTDFPFVQLGWLRNQKLLCGGGQASIATDFLITSGTLCRLATLAAENVGPFDESLFIDNVDMEWSYRARARGWRLYGVCATSLDHRLGDHRHQVLPGLTLVVHSPVRVYYMTRNRIALYRRGYIPLKWKLKDSLRMILKLVSTSLFLTPHLRYLRMGCLGVVDALRRRSGRLQE
jgi:rhamnosyltransferase